MRFQIVTLKPAVAGISAREWGNIEGELDMLETAMDALGHKLDGIREGKHLRPSLQGQPTFKGIYGPMHGVDETGADVVRYESHEAYEVLSR